MATDGKTNGSVIAATAPKVASRRTAIVTLAAANEREEAEKLAKDGTELAVEALVEQLREAGVERPDGFRRSLTRFVEKQHKDAIDRAAPKESEDKPADPAALVTKLAALGEVTAAEALARQAAAAEAEALVAKVTSTKVKGLTKQFDLTHVTKNFQKDYLGAIAKARPVDPAVAAERTTQECNDAAETIGNAVDDAYDEIMAFCGKFGFETVEFTSQYEAFGAIKAWQAASMETLHIEVVDGALQPTIEQSPALRDTPVGQFLIEGQARPAVVMISTGGSPQGAATRVKANRSIRHAFLASIAGATLQGVSAWLRREGVKLADQAMVQKVASHAGWSRASTLYRTGLLLLESWQERLTRKAASVAVIAEVTEARKAALDRNKVEKPAMALKALQELITLEFGKLLDSQQARFGTAIDEARREALNEVDLIRGDTHFEPTEAPNHREFWRLTLKPDIPNALKDHIANLGKELMIKGYSKATGGKPKEVSSFGAEFDEAWKARIRPYISHYGLGRIFDQEASRRPTISAENVDIPVSDALASTLIERQLNLFDQRLAGRDFTTDIMRANNLGAIWKGIQKVPGALLGTLAPIFAITIFFGYGMSKLKDAVPEVDTTLLWWIVGGLLGVFAVISWLVLLRRAGQAREAFADAVKVRLLDLHDQMLRQLQQSYFEAARTGLERAVADYFRRIKDDCDAATNEREVRRVGDELKLDRALRQLKQIEERHKHTGKVLDTAIANVGKQKKPLAELAEVICDPN